MPRRRIWSETLPHATLRTPAVLGLLRRYDLDLLAAVRPPDLPELPALLAACRDHGVRLALWPMLADADGRWANARNARAFARWIATLLDGLGTNRTTRALPAEIALDLEPAFHEVSRIFSRVRHPDRRGRHAWRPTAALTEARDVFAALAADVRARGMTVSAAVVPLVLFDRAPPAHGAWQWLMGTPVDGLAWDHASVMLYTSLAEGFSRGALRRRDVHALLAAGCRAALARFGAAAGVSLGAVGTGALGDEPVYRDPGELAGDVAVARAAGMDALTLFDLGGVLARPPAEAWLEAFAHTPAHPSATADTWRAGTALAVGAAATRALGAASAWLPAAWAATERARQG